MNYKAPSFQINRCPDQVREAHKISLINHLCAQVNQSPAKAIMSTNLSAARLSFKHLFGQAELVKTEHEIADEYLTKVIND